MTLQEILYKIGVNKEYEYINDLLETPQVKGLIGITASRLKYNKQEGREIAASIIKEVMLKNYVYQKDYTEQKFVKYIQRILFDRVRNVLTKEKITSETFAECKAYEDPFESIEEKIDLITKVRELSKLQQKIIMNFYVFNKPGHEITKELNISESTFKYQKQKALKILLEKLTNV